MSTSDTQPGVTRKSVEYTTDYEMGQDNIRPLGLDIHNPVFLISSLVIFGFVLISLANQEASAEFFGWLRPWLTRNVRLVFWSCSVNIITLFCLVLIVLPVGSVRIGGKDCQAGLFLSGLDRDECSRPGSASACCSLACSSRSTTTSPKAARARPLGIDISAIPGNEYIGVVGTIHHWGLEGLGGLCGGRALPRDLCYNLGLPLTLRSAFYPILGERVWGWWGHAIDTLAVFATLFGSDHIARARRAAGGGGSLNEVAGSSPPTPSPWSLIIGITLIALGSVLLGMDKGVKRLSEINMVMAVALFACSWSS